MPTPLFDRVLQATFQSFGVPKTPIERAQFWECVAEGCGTDPYLRSVVESIRIVAYRRCLHCMHHRTILHSRVPKYPKQTVIECLKCKSLPVVGFTGPEAYDRAETHWLYWNPTITTGYPEPIRTLFEAKTRFNVQLDTSMQEWLIIADWIEEKGDLVSFGVAEKVRVFASGPSKCCPNYPTLGCLLRSLWHPDNATPEHHIILGMRQTQPSRI